MEKKIALVIRSVLLIMILATVLMFIFWLPKAIAYFKLILFPSLIDLGSVGAFIYKSLVAFLYIFAALVIIPALIVFVMAFKFPSAIISNSIFTQKTAKLIKNISIIVFADCMLFGAGVFCFILLGDNMLSPALAFVDVIGIALALILYVLSLYVNRAAILKEEADHTL